MQPRGNGKQGGESGFDSCYKTRVILAAMRINVGFSFLKVLDMGCAESKLLRLLRRVPCVRELVGVDIQTSLLEAQQHGLQPLISDFVMRRPDPLTIHLMHGLLYHTRSDP